MLNKRPLQTLILLPLLGIMMAKSAEASLRVTTMGGPGLYAKLRDDQQNNFKLTNFSLDLAARRHLVWDWDFMIGVGLHYGFVSYNRDNLEYKGYTDSIGATGSLLHPITLGWDLQLQGELVFRGLIVAKAQGVGTANGKEVNQSTVRTEDGFFGYAGRIMFLHAVRWKYREFYAGIGAEYLFHQMQNHELNQITEEDNTSTSTSTITRLDLPTNASVSYATVFIAIGIELFKDDRNKGAGLRSSGDGNGNNSSDSEEKVRKSYPPYGL